MIDITPIVQAVISLACVLVTVFIIPWLKSRGDDARLSQIYTVVAIAVEAAEKMFKGPGRGTEKLLYVEEYLAQKGIRLDTADITAYINSAVLNLRNEAGE